MIATAVKVKKTGSGTKEQTIKKNPFEGKFMKNEFSILSVAPLTSKASATVLILGSKKGWDLIKQEFDNNNVITEMSFIDFKGLAKRQNPFAGTKFDYIIAMGLSSLPKNKSIVKEAMNMLANEGVLIEDSKTGNTHPPIFSTHQKIGGNVFDISGNFMDNK